MGRQPMGDGIVARSAVLQRLRAARGGDLVAVRAPAGYGKTTAVALWDDAEERDFAWVRIDGLDDDPAHLLLHIATAVDRVCGLDPAVLRYLSGPGRAPIPQLIPALIEALESCGPMVVVLDDVHELSSRDAVDTLHAFVDAAPANVTVAVIGRWPLEAARRRLQDRVIDIGIDDLRFSAEEAAAVFRAVAGPESGALAPAVLERCEGWPAGVVLAATALRDGATADTFTGRDRLVADYLVEEVLDRVDDDATVFLLESAVLDRFCADDLDEILDRRDAAAQLEMLVRSGNLLLVSLDNERLWYRYHHLFGDLLRDRMRRRDPARFRWIAGRAGEVLDRRGDIDGALAQAVLAGDRERAAALVGREAVRLGFDGRAGVLARRLDLLDAQTIAEYPDAAIAQAWRGVTSGDADLIHRSLLMAHRADRGQPLGDGTPSVEVAVALVGSLVGVGGVEEVIRHADTVRKAGDHLVNPWWGAATVMMGAAQSMVGNVARARELLESALPVIGDLPGFHAAALAHLALIDLGDGDDPGCLARSAAARDIVDRHDLCDVVPMVVVYAVSAVAAARTGETGRAYEAVARTELLLGRLGSLAARTALLGHGLLAWTAVVLNDRDLLARHLAEAAKARRREPQARALWQRVERVRAMVGGEDRRPLTAAELRLLPYLATHMSLQRIADELRVGRETTKSQAGSIYRKLGVSSRADAVGEAKRVGLLED